MNISLKKYFEKLLDEKEKSYNQRFASQEEAVKTAERNRDTAINKAEMSIEKKSDAVYVKLTDLQKALTEVMLRPEIESRLKGLSEKVEDLKTSRDKGEGTGAGIQKFIGWIIAAIAVTGFLMDRFS